MIRFTTFLAVIGITLTAHAGNPSFHDDARPELITNNFHTPMTSRHEPAIRPGSPWILFGKLNIDSRSAANHEKALPHNPKTAPTRTQDKTQEKTQEKTQGRNVSQNVI
jgi:hypothetical protein